MARTATETIGSAIEAGGYLSLGLLIFAENLFPPIPSELILPLAGFTSRLNGSTLLPPSPPQRRVQ